MNRLATHLEPSLAGSLRAFSSVLGKYSASEQEQIAEALAAAAHWHGFTRRKSGPLYLAHLLQTATIVALVHSDVDTVRAALLHDVLEDTEVTGLQLEQRFGKEIRRLVESVTKHPTSSEREFLEKVYTRAQEDIRVVRIKVADRIANLTHGTHSVLSAEKEEIFLEETETYYVQLLCKLPQTPPALTSLLIWAKNEAEYSMNNRIV